MTLPPETLKRLEDTGHVLAKIQEHSQGERGRSGAFPCPACGTGTVRWAVSGYNGHRQARCSTNNCVCFME